MGSAGGSIVNISSVAARLGAPTTSVYSATKAAVDAITRSLAKSWGRRKSASIRSIPAWSKPKAHTPPASRRAISASRSKSQTPLGRIGQPKDIAPTVVFLASDDSSWITGETFYVAGGLR